MNSTGALSFEGRETETRPAGNELGVTLRVLRFLGLVTTSEVIVTKAMFVRDQEGVWSSTVNLRRFWSLRNREAPSSGLLLTLPIIAELRVARVVGARA